MVLQTPDCRDNTKLIKDPQMVQPIFVYKFVPTYVRSFGISEIQLKSNSNALNLVVVFF